MEKREIGINELGNFKNTADAKAIVLGVEKVEKNEEKNINEDKLYINLFVKNRYKKMESIKVKINSNKSIEHTQNYIEKNWINEIKYFKNINIFETNKKGKNDKYYKNTYYSYNLTFKSE